YIPPQLVAKDVIIDSPIARELRGGKCRFELRQLLLPMFQPAATSLRRNVVQPVIKAMIAPQRRFRGAQLEGLLQMLAKKFAQPLIGVLPKRQRTSGRPEN